MKRKGYTSIMGYSSKRIRLINYSRKRHGTVQTLPPNRTLYDIKHRCFLQRNSTTGITYAGTFCLLERCGRSFSKDTCEDCLFSAFL